MAKSPLKYDPEVYTPQGLRKNLEYKEARAEYARLRSVALRRLKTFEGTEYTESQIYKRFSGYFPTLTEIGTNKARLLHYLTDAARFLQREGSTLAGQKRIESRTIDTLHERGYGFVNKENLRRFGEYMKIARAKSTSRYYDSVRAAEIFGENLGEPDPEVVADEYLEWEAEELFD